MSRYLKRPLSGAHWSLLVVLVLLWEFTIWGESCREGPYNFEVALLTATICTALWINHIQVGPILQARAVARIAGGALYDLLSFALVLIVAAIPIVIFLPTYSCYTPRSKVSEIVLYASSFKTEITQRALKTKSLANVGIGMQVLPSRRVKGGMVTKDGVIIVTSEDPPAVVILTPDIQGGEIKWQCRGYPTKYMPAMCRE